MEKKEFIEEWRHFCNCLDFVASVLDARAVTFMNEFEVHVMGISETQAP